MVQISLFCISSLYHKFILAHINARPFLGTDVLKSPPTPWFWAWFPSVSSLMRMATLQARWDAWAAHYRKPPPGLLESLLIVLCHSVFKNSLVQRLFTVSAICKWLFAGNFSGALKDKHSFYRKKSVCVNVFVNTGLRGGFENKHHLVMFEIRTNR